MKTLYLMCGMPFSGKTTLGKSIAIKQTATTFEPPQPDENVIKYYANQLINKWIAKHFVTNSN